LLIRASGEDYRASRAGVVLSSNSRQARIGFYDCLHVALAEREGSELVTADTKMVTTLKPTFPFIIDLASLP